MDNLLSYEHVDICYNGVPAVKDVSFSLFPGEILGIAGESGSGKSTLIKAAMGLLGEGGLVTRGDIWYQGRDLPDLSGKELREINGKEIGMVFQDAGSSFCPIRKVIDQLYEGVQAHENVSKSSFLESAKELMKKIGFSDPERILDSYPFELSGGMQQRVGIAAAMLLKPKVILADEPTSALDSVIQKQVVDEMLLLRETFGTAIIIVTHNIGVIRAMADHVLIMKNGENVEYGPAAQVLGHPRNAYTQKLMAAVPVLHRDA